MSRFINEFDPKEIDVAGRVLVDVPAPGEDDREWVDAFELVSQWRATHAGPLRTFRNNLQRRVRPGDIVAQRLKRMPTIRSKLEQKSWLKLSRMNDIGGCRAIVPTAADAFRVGIGLLDSRIRHELVRHDDYIDRPRDTGYRGLHLVYRYVSDRNPHWQGIKTEIQLRSRLQHQWATAVETVGLFTGDDLKSNLGDARWLRFFALMSSVIAVREGYPKVPNTPDNETVLVNEVRALAIELGAVEQLVTFKAITSGMQQSRIRGNPWIVLELDLDAPMVELRPFRAKDEDAASTWYAERELEFREMPNRHVVMVSARSVNELRRAYPNFFADLTRFRDLVEETI